MTNDFYGDFNLKDILNENITDFFSTDVKTILGKNIVKNFVCKINFEIKTFGYSDSANEIAEFYEECKKSGGIIKFVTNPVIRMILILAKDYSDVKRYLNDRIFDDVEIERIQSLENTFKNNEDICEKNQEDEHNYKLKQEIKRKKIKKIQNERQCTFEQAEKIYEELQAKKIQNNLKKELENFLSVPINKGLIVLDDKDTLFKKNEETDKNEEIDLGDESEPKSSNDDNFWKL